MRWGRRRTGIMWFRRHRLAAREAGKPVAILATLPDLMPQWRSFAIRDAGLLPLGRARGCLRCHRGHRAGGGARGQAALECANRRPVSTSPGVSGQAPFGGARRGRAAGRTVADGPEAAGRIAGDLGCRVALKGMGAAHKSEAGLLALGLTGCRGGCHPGRGHGLPCEFLVEEMLEGAVTELLVGVVADPAHGFVSDAWRGRGADGDTSPTRRRCCCLWRRGTSTRRWIGCGSRRCCGAIAANRAVAREALVDAILRVQDFVGAHRARLARGGDQSLDLH